MAEQEVLSVDCATTSNWFGSGAFILAPGATKTWRIQVPAPAKPVRTSVYVWIPSFGITARNFEARIGPSEWRERGAIRTYGTPTVSSRKLTPWFLPVGPVEVDQHEFARSMRLERGSFDGFDRWEDVPRSALLCKWQTPTVFKSELLPPMLFPNECGPKPWGTKYEP